MDEKNRELMTYFEADAHSFVMRIWREPAPAGEWRGWLEHVQSKQRHYFRQLGEIATLIAAYVGDVDSLENQAFMPASGEEQAP